MRKIKFLGNKIPQEKDIVLIISTTAFFIYSWSIIGFLWKLPSWIIFLSIEDIISIAAYIFTTNMFETLFILLIILTLNVVLPSKFFLKRFAARGNAFVISLTIWAAIIHYSIAEELFTNDRLIFTVGVISLFSTILFVYLAGRISRLEQALVSLSNRFSAFLYLWIPLSVIGFVLV